MTFSTPNLDLPYIAPAQAQKHVTHNEAIRKLDALVQLSVKDHALTAPPANPQDGARYVIAPGASDIWGGKDGQIAAFQDGAWAYFMPQTGWRAWSVAGQSFIVFDGSLWGVQGGSQTQAEQFGINANADTVNRLTVQSEAVLLNHDGAGHQLKINKAGETDTASLVFQSGFTGHAEFGLAGDNDFHVKTSPDGVNFNAALSISANSGAVHVPGGLNPDIMMPSVTASGGAQSVYGPPNVITIALSRKSQNLTANRIYFTPIYVDRPTRFEGGFVTVNNAGTTVGAVIRAGLFKLGEASGNNWSIGERVADFGAQPVAAADHKMFDLVTPQWLSPGWYLCAVGTNGSGVQLRYVEWFTPGLYHYLPYGSGNSADIRISGPARYLYINSQATEITNGLPETYAGTPAVDLVNTNFDTVQMLIPKWTRWESRAIFADTR